MPPEGFTGPIRIMTFEELIEGDPVYGHNFQDMINDMTDRLGNVAEYAVRDFNGYFGIYVRYN